MGSISTNLQLWPAKCWFITYNPHENYSYAISTLVKWDKMGDSCEGQFSVGPDQQHCKNWNLNWLVVGPPLWKIWKSIGMIIPNIWENKIHVPNPQPVKWLFGFCTPSVSRAPHRGDPLGQASIAIRQSFVADLVVAIQLAHMEWLNDGWGGNTMNYLEDHPT